MLTSVTHRGIVVRKRVNAFLDRNVQPVIILFGRNCSGFSFWVYGGVIVGIVVMITLSVATKRALPVMAALISLALTLAVVLHKSDRIAGHTWGWLDWAKRGVYHFQLMVLISSALLLMLLRAPVFPNLDILVIGFLISQALGRLGCLTAGCCHGKPHRWGVCYGDRYVSRDYPYFTERVRLFPVQILESVWLFVVFVAAIALLFRTHQPGEVLSLYVVGYGLGRYFLEFLRGDLGRVSFLGFTEPQWTATLLTLLIIGLEAGGLLTFRVWHVVVGGIMASLMIILPVQSCLHAPTRQQVFAADHIKEILQTVNWLTRQALLQYELKDWGSIGKDLTTATTSLYLQITIELGINDEELIFHYHLRQAKGRLTKKLVHALSSLLIRLKHPDALYQLEEQEEGFFHLAVSPVAKSKQDRIDALNFK